MQQISTSQPGTLEKKCEEEKITNKPFSGGDFNMSCRVNAEMENKAYNTMVVKRR